MPVSTRFCLSLLLVLAAAPARGQVPLEVEAAAPLPERPRPPRERDQLEARRRFALGLLRERDGQLLVALEHFQAAVRLDPEAAPPRKALIPLYLALDRNADALAACRRTLDLDPNDYETWYVYAGLLKNQGSLPEAAAALARAVACPGLKDNPDLFVQMSFDLGRMYEDAREFDRALEVLDGLLEVLEQDQSEVRPAEVYECIGRVCSQAGRPERAAAAFRKARAALDGQDPVYAARLTFLLAQAYEAQGKSAAALRQLSDYLRTQPPGIEPYELLVRLLQTVGRDDEVVPALREAADRDAHNVALKLFLARQYIRAHQPAAAEQVYRQLAAESPTPEVYRGLFTLYQAEGRAGDALNLLDRTVADGSTDERGQKPGDPAARGRARAMVTALLGEGDLAKGLIPAARARLRDGPALQPETQRFLALVATKMRDFAAAEDFYRLCLKQAVTAQSEALLYEGLLKVLWAAEKYEAVARACRQGLREARHTDGLLFHTHLARALGVLGKTDQALAEADRAVQASGAEARFLCRLLRVEILQAAGRFSPAEAECRELLKEAPRPEAVRRVRYTLSNVYTAARRFPEAEEQLRLVLREDPDDATANNDLGYILADQNKDLEEAEKLIRKAVELDGQQREAAKDVVPADNQPNAAYIDSLGWVLYRRGRWPEARRELERAVALPDGAGDPVVWDHLGDVYSRLGEAARARKAWEKARTLYEKDSRRRRDEKYEELQQKLQSKF